MEPVHVAGADSRVRTRSEVYVEFSIIRTLPRFLACPFNANDIMLIVLLKQTEVWDE